MKFYSEYFDFHVDLTWFDLKNCHRLLLFLLRKYYYSAALARWRVATLKCIRFLIQLFYVKSSVSVVFKHPHTQILKDIEIHKHTLTNTNQVTTLHHRNQLNQGPNLCSGRRLAFYSSAVSHPARLHLNVVFCIYICICMYLYF